MYSREPNVFKFRGKLDVPEDFIPRRYYPRTTACLFGTFDFVSKYAHQTENNTSFKADEIKRCLTINRVQGRPKVFIHSLEGF